MAAAYLFHIAKNHPFVDGNKRVGAVAARVFLLTNGVHFDPDEQEYERFVLGLAAGELDKADAAEFSREHCQSS